MKAGRNRERAELPTNDHELPKSRRALFEDKHEGPRPGASETTARRRTRGSENTDPTQREQRDEHHARDKEPAKSITGQDEMQHELHTHDHELPKSRRSLVDAPTGTRAPI